MGIVNEMRRASFQIKEAPSAGRRAVMSTARMDRVGDVIDQAGWVLEEFAANPVMLHEHDPSRPVGVWKDVRVEAGELSGEPVWHPPEINAAADVLRKLYEGGWLKGISVGFRVLEAEPMPDGRGWLIRKALLLECSLVAIPANADALLKAAPGARMVAIDGPAKTDLWAGVDREALRKWVAPATATKVESAPMTLTDDVRAAIKAAVAEAMKQPAAQTPPKAGDDGAAAGNDADLLAVELAESEADLAELAAEIEDDAGNEEAA
mgnify:FL=1